MFSLGLFELILLCILSLIFIGPKQLPEVAAFLLRFLHQMKNLVQDAKEQLSFSVDSTDSIKEDLQEQRQQQTQSQQKKESQQREQTQKKESQQREQTQKKESQQRRQKQKQLQPQKQMQSQMQQLQRQQPQQLQSQLQTQNKKDNVHLHKET